MISNSLQTKLTAIIVSIILLSLGTLGCLNYWKARQLLFTSAKERTVDLATNYAEQIGLWIGSHKSEVMMLAHSIPITNGNIEVIVPLLKDVYRTNNDYLSITFIQPDGTFYDSSGFTGNISHREYFQRAIKGETVITDPLISVTVGVPFVAIVTPVEVNGKIIGCISGVVNLESISRKVLAIKAGETGFAYVLQDDGLIIIHPNKEFILKNNLLTANNTPQALKEAVYKMTKNEKGVFRYQYEGVEKLTAYAPIPGMNWSLAVTLPTAEVTGQLEQLTLISFVTSISVLILTVFVVIIFARRISKPIKDLEVAANRVASGDLTAMNLKITSNDEVGRLGQAFEKMTSELEISYALIRKSEEHAKHNALYDNLTGLCNRTLFTDRLNHSLQEARCNNQLVALLFLDLDGFKAINDSYGHSQGDLVLKEVATRLNLIASPTDTVCRLGGDEYTMILPDIKSKDNVEIIIQKIVESFVPPFHLENHKAPLSVSIGISIFPFNGDDLDTLLKHADDAMYEVKASGKNGYKFYGQGC